MKDYRCKSSQWKRCWHRVLVQVHCFPSQVLALFSINVCLYSFYEISFLSCVKWSFQSIHTVENVRFMKKSENNWWCCRQLMWYSCKLSTLFRPLSDFSCGVFYFESYLIKCVFKIFDSWYLYKYILKRLRFYMRITEDAYNNGGCKYHATYIIWVIVDAKNPVKRWVLSLLCCWSRIGSDAYFS